MCGITGFLQPGAANAGELAAICTRMTDAITHRGPDSGGVWVEPGFSLALGHGRLSIIDLSEAGPQPMLSVSGRYVVSFNGEI
jgi:asparagine synthase (glutamine-hydrolysing)